MDTRRTLNGMESTFKQLTDTWWLLLAQGIASILFGVLALVWPGATLVALAIIFGWFVLFQGIIEVAFAIGAVIARRSWGWRFASGVLGVIVGLIILRWPGLTALTIMLFVGVWAIILGLTRVIGVIAERDVLRDPWLLALQGIVAVLFGVAMMVWPNVGLVTLAVLIGIFAIVHGVIFSVLAFRLRALGEQLTGPERPAGALPA